MPDLATVEEFRTAARDGAALPGNVFRLATGPATEVQGEARTLRFCFSDGTVDRAGDTIDPKGWQLEAFNKNPVALWCHSSWEPPIGRASNVGVTGKRLMGNIEFAPAETYAFADTIYRLAKDGYINAVSVGFNPLEWSFVNDKDRPYGIDFKRQELLEISPCPVPCNGNALSEARAKGIDTRPLREWAEKVLDGEGGKVLVARATLEEIFKDAKTPHAARAKYRDLIEHKEPEVTEIVDPPPAEEKTIVETKAGRRISQENMTHINQAMDHLKSVMDSNAQTDDGDGDDDTIEGGQFPAEPDADAGKSIAEEPKLPTARERALLTLAEAGRTVTTH